MTIQRMDNVLIVVDDLEAAKAFFVELGMELEGETTVEGPSVDRLIGLQNVRATLALMRTPDGHGRIELDKFHTPEAIRTGPENVPVNALGIRRIMFAVDDIDDVVARLRAHGAELVGEVVQYEDTYRLCYVRGPEGIIVGLAEQLGLMARRDRPATNQNDPPGEAENDNGRDTRATGRDHADPRNFAVGCREPARGFVLGVSTATLGRTASLSVVLVHLLLALGKQTVFLEGGRR